MDTRQFHKRCFALLLACALALGCLPRAQAASRSAIESLQSQQASLTVQKAELQKKLDGIRSSQGQALNKKNLVEQQLNVLNQQIQVSENLLAQYVRQITEKEAELEQAKAKEAEYQAEFAQRGRAMEERGNVSYWSVLFQASDFSDLLDRIDMIGEIMDADDQVLDQLAEARQAVAQAKTDLEASRQGQQETLAQQQSQQAQLQAQQAEVDQLIQEIATQGDVFMVVSDAATNDDDGHQALADGVITRGEVQRCAMNLCRFLMNTHAMEHFLENGSTYITAAPVDLTSMTCVATAAPFPRNRAQDVTLPTDGTTALEITYHADTGDLAQIPVSVIWNTHRIGFFMVHGTEGRKAQITLSATLSGATAPLKFVTTNSALNIDEIKFYQS